MTKRKSNFFDKIGNLIPGYRGYIVRDEKRNNDNCLRNAIASQVEQSEIEIVKHQQSLIRNNQIQICQEWEIVRKSLDTFKIKIKNASYGESSFFSNEQIKENELDQIYTLDLELAERVNLISKTINNEINESLSPILVNQQLHEINTLLVKRNDFISKF